PPAPKRAAPASSPLLQPLPAPLFSLPWCPSFIPHFLRPGPDDSVRDVDVQLHIFFHLADALYRLPSATGLPLHVGVTLVQLSGRGEPPHLFDVNGKLMSCPL